MCNCYHRNGKEIGYLQAVIIATEVDQFLVTKSVFQQGPDTLTFQTLLNYVLTYLLIYLLSYSTEKSSSWESNQLSASQKFPHVIWYAIINFSFCKCTPSVPALSQINLFYAHPPVQLNITFPSTPGYFKVASFLYVSQPKPYILLSSSPYVLLAPHFIFIQILSPNQIWWRA